MISPSMTDEEFYQVLQAEGLPEGDSQILKGKCVIVSSSLA